MGYQCTAGYKIAPGIFEVYIKESTDIAQLMCSGHLFMMDRKDLAKAKEGKTRSAKKILADYNSLPNILNKEQFIAKLGAINGKKQFSDQVFRELTELGLSSS